MNSIVNMKCSICGREVDEYVVSKGRNLCFRCYERSKTCRDCRAFLQINDECYCIDKLVVYDIVKKFKRVNIDETKCDPNGACTYNEYRKRLGVI